GWRGPDDGRILDGHTARCGPRRTSVPAEARRHRRRGGGGHRLDRYGVPRRSSEVWPWPRARPRRPGAAPEEHGVVGHRMPADIDPKLQEQLRRAGDGGSVKAVIALDTS